MSGARIRQDADPVVVPTSDGDDGRAALDLVEDPVQVSTESGHRDSLATVAFPVAAEEHARPTTALDDHRVAGAHPLAQTGQVLSQLPGGDTHFHSDERRRRWRRKTREVVPTFVPTLPSDLTGWAIQAATFAELGIRHLRTRPRRPQTNGKAERFIGTLQREWAYARLFRSNADRLTSLPRWLDTYNRRRPHAGLGGLPPMTVLVNKLGGNDN